MKTPEGPESFDDARRLTDNDEAEELPNGRSLRGWGDLEHSKPRRLTLIKRSSNVA